MTSVFVYRQWSPMITTGNDTLTLALINSPIIKSKGKEKKQKNNKPFDSLVGHKYNSVHVNLWIVTKR